MRQIGHLDTAEKASLFADFLVASDIRAQSEPDEDLWAIWVFNEDQCMHAQEMLEHFKANPEDVRYEDATDRAKRRLRIEQKQNREASKNLIDVRSQWSTTGQARRIPLVVTLCTICVVLALLTYRGALPRIRYALFFSSPIARDSQESAASDPFRDIRAGQVWRLVTPVFLHSNSDPFQLHLLFNLYWLVVLGGQIEKRRGWMFLSLFFLVVAVFSCAAQAVLEGPFFVGMSGVNYGIFGFVWMKSRLDPWSGFFVHKNTVFVLVGWFIICFLGVIPNVANTAHAAGLIIGIILGYGSTILGRGPRNRPAPS